MPLGGDEPWGSASASRSHVTEPPANPPGAWRVPKTFVLGTRHDSTTCARLSRYRAPMNERYQW
ncbi:hypothetical protein [Lentzea jiangxiensis]|uniref:Uncharacterized protein n=1 Tax=Lentzea jiangxiensis TaxID=641025 RepID=A0A1H0LCS6_9PSEU|nr:hypothetical protein [Lentzea jiangxiensis]SDO65836.1 hypothetical protein SAMN05421507_103267 [Lentzea jiangxiensis]